MSEDEQAGDDGARRFGTATVALVTALVALLSGGIGLAFDLFPELRPDPRTTRSADIAVVAIETGVPRREWLARSTGSAEELRRLRDEVLRADGIDRDDRRAVRSHLAYPGTIFYVQTTVEGLKRDRVSLLWTLYEARGARRVGDPNLQDEEAVDVDLDAPTDRSVVQTWARNPTDGSGPFFARFELRDRGGVALAVADSKRFRPPAF